MLGNTRGDGLGILPTFGNGRSGGGDSMYGAARASKPAVAKSSIATIAWALLSLALIAGGLTYCSKRLESTTVKSGTIRGITKLLSRMRMIQGELVRVKNGEFADVSSMIRSAQRNFGHANSIVHSGPGWEDVDAGPYGGGFYDDDDGYDGNQDASEYDDEGGDDLPRSSQGGGRPGQQRPNTPLAKRPASGSAQSSQIATQTATPKKRTEEWLAVVQKNKADRKAAKKNAQRAKDAEDRRKRALERPTEPDSSMSSMIATKTAAPKEETEAERKAAVEKKAFDDMAARKNAQRAKYAEDRRKRALERTRELDSAKSSNIATERATPKEETEAERKAAVEEKVAFARIFDRGVKPFGERRKPGLEPIGEPDEQKGRRPERRQAVQHPMEHREHDSDDRFPGDAGTMKDKDRDELARMEAEGMAAQTHRMKSQRAYEEASRMRVGRRKPDVQTKQMGNNLQGERKQFLGDPDNQPPSLKVGWVEEERPKLERSSNRTLLAPRRAVRREPWARVQRTRIKRIGLFRSCEIAWRNCRRKR